MKLLFKLMLASSAVLVTAMANAQNFSFSHTWDQSDPQMANRLFRDANPSVYGTPKPFPGTLTGPVFFFTFNVSNPNNVVSRLDVTSTNTGPATFHSFTSAYFSLFDSTNLATNYAGDEGSSPPFGGPDTSFSVAIPALTDVVIVVNSLNTSGDIGGSFTVNGSLTAVPEPASMLAMIGGIGAIVARRRRRKNS